eukprot:TRINITY_DN59979_c0_g1_i1.p1 TRINITY_DN59979_c0_g1~~TRINITY_DN59979_c0_g1_i1.p1  ORF type:complete len:491 (+),score=98.63 TRINITY_DN59979_c0_g1_i1:196-1473(+)
MELWWCGTRCALELGVPLLPPPDGARTGLSTRVAGGGAAGLSDEQLAAVRQADEWLRGAVKEASRSGDPGRPIRAVLKGSDTRFSAKALIRACDALSGPVTIKDLNVMIGYCATTADASTVLERFARIPPNEYVLVNMMKICRCPAETAYWFGVMTDGYGVQAHTKQWNCLLDNFLPPQSPVDVPGVQRVLLVMARAQVSFDDVTLRLLGRIAGESAKAWVEHARREARDGLLHIVSDQLADLALLTPGGVLVKDLPALFRENYGEELTLNRFRVQDIAELVRVLPNQRIAVLHGGPDAVLVPRVPHGETMHWCQAVGEPAAAPVRESPADGGAHAAAPASGAAARAADPWAAELRSSLLATNVSAERSGEIIRYLSEELGVVCSQTLCRVVREDYGRLQLKTMEKIKVKRFAESLDDEGEPRCA